MTEASADDVIQRGLAAWSRGDLDALESILHPAVTLRAMQPGPWDCENREQVMQLLRRHKSQRSAGDPRSREVRRVDDHTYLASGLGGGGGRATRVSIADGRVVSLQQVSTDEPDLDAEAAVAAIRAGDNHSPQMILARRPDLATIEVPGYRGRTLLHIAVDWPGHYPNVRATIDLLVHAGAKVTPPTIGKQQESPLHWAASSDDIDALDALLDAGADINATGAVIGGGTAVNNATAFGQWKAARRLVERGAQVSTWDAAALGLTDRLRSEPAENLDELFWAACHGGHRET
ncbi:MAG: ankyrin repeat domain-containing protein [Actinomycetota bacterium]|nr:ankyrin repeat domain-containing protein [Actinomycetota bacterium]